MISAWRAAAETATGEAAERYTRLADQLQQIMDNDQISYETLPRPNWQGYRIHEIMEMRGEPLHRVCTQCKISLPTTEFPPSRMSHTGLHARCQRCFVAGKRKSRWVETP